MSDMIWVASPEGKTEEHTPQNARDLMRNAGWKAVGNDAGEVKKEVAAETNRAAKVKDMKAKAAAKAKENVEVKKSAPAKKADADK